MNAILRIAAWLLAIALVIAPATAVLNGWIAGSRWPMRHLVITGQFDQVIHYFDRLGPPHLFRRSENRGDEGVLEPPSRGVPGVRAIAI